MSVLSSITLTMQAVLLILVCREIRVDRAALRELAERVERLEEFAPLFDVMVCRRCGCTDEVACASGCWWVAEDMCSSCADDAAAAGGSSLEGGSR